MPDVSITSDFIVGFPGETQEQFEDTISIIDEAGLDYSNTASYSPRRQTPAATCRDRFIDEKTKKRASCNFESEGERLLALFKPKMRGQSYGYSC